MMYVCIYMSMYILNLHKCPPPGELLTSRQISSNLCTYCTHLAGFFKDDMSPWVLYSIHIQRVYRMERRMNLQCKSAPRINNTPFYLQIC
jgi:hypothetical protein